MRVREFHSISKKIERRTQRPDHGRHFAPRASHLVADRDGIVLADDLPEVAGGSKVVVQSAVSDKENVPSRDLAVDDATDIDAGLADEVAAELDDKTGLRKRCPRAARHVAQVVADGSELERFLAREIGNAEAAADIEHTHRSGRRSGQTN